MVSRLLVTVIITVIVALLVTVELGSNSGDINGNIVVNSDSDNGDNNSDYKSLIFKNDIICEVKKQLHMNSYLFGNNLSNFLLKMC